MLLTCASAAICPSQRLEPTRRVNRADVEAIKARTQRLNKDQRRSLWLAYAIAGRIAQDPAAALRKASSNLEKMRKTARGQTNLWLDEWERLLKGPVERVWNSWCPGLQRVAKCDRIHRSPTCSAIPNVRPSSLPGAIWNAEFVNREELSHLLRAAARVTDDPEIVVLGSQAILGTYKARNLPAEATMSVEADIAFRNDPNETKADQVDGDIGELSDFHEEYGYYAQGISISTAVLPAGWERRVVRYEQEDAQIHEAVLS